MSTTYTKFANAKKSTTASCPALFLAAPSSGQGKTTFTAALARTLTKQGKRVHIFKTGPDYLDPQILEQASGISVVPLDLWMAGDTWCQQKLFEAAQVADLILIEGAMGMFDGTPSSADLAERFGIPIAIVMDVKGMAQTAAIMAAGLAQARPQLSVLGLIANNCGSERHRQLIEEALPENLPLLMTLKRDSEIALPERHLGLVQACEVYDDLEQRFELAAAWLLDAGVQLLIDQVPSITFEAPATSLLPNEHVKTPLHGKTIAIARDSAFSFIYDANLELLERLGAELRFFSPMADSELPAADACWLPGGYPELHAKVLADNTAMRQQIKAFFQADKPILAECGGFLYCLQTLTDLDNNSYPMAGLLDGVGVMRGKRGCQGMQTARLPEGDVRGHAHHRSRSEHTPEPFSYGQRQRHSAPGEEIFRQRRLTASFLHLFFPSNQDAIAQLFCAPNSTVEIDQLEVLNAH